MKPDKANIKEKEEEMNTEEVKMIKNKNDQNMHQTFLKRRRVP